MTPMEEAICKLDDRLKAVPRRFAFLPVDLRRRDG